jgi:hypothetical protein
MFKQIMLVQYEFPIIVSGKGQDFIKKLLIRQVLDWLGMLICGHYHVGTIHGFPNSVFTIRSF